VCTPTYYSHQYCIKIIIEKRVELLTIQIVELKIYRIWNFKKKKKKERKFYNILLNIIVSLVQFITLSNTR